MYRCLSCGYIGEYCPGLAAASSCDSCGSSNLSLVGDSGTSVADFCQMNGLDFEAEGQRVFEAMRGRWPR